MELEGARVLQSHAGCVEARHCWQMELLHPGSISLAVQPPRSPLEYLVGYGLPLLIQRPPTEALVMAQVMGFLPPVWETWIEFLIPGLGTA